MVIILLHTNQYWSIIITVTMVITSSRSYHLIPIPVPPVKPLLRRTVKRFLRLLPSILLLLFVVSLIFVTLMQIAVIHTNRRLTVNKISSFSTPSSSPTSSPSNSLSSTLSPIPMSASIGSRRKVNQIQSSSGNGNNVFTSNEHYSVSDTINENISKDKLNSSVLPSISSPSSIGLQEPKKPQLLRIEALLDKTTTSRDQSNSNYFQNLVNAQRVKKIINSIKAHRKAGLLANGLVKFNASSSTDSLQTSSPSMAFPRVPSNQLKDSLLPTKSNHSMEYLDMSSPAVQGSHKLSCPLVPHQLVGRTRIDLDVSSDSWMKEESDWHSNLELGGSWEPADCYPRHRVAIIIPYRDRLQHLRILLHHLHPILQRQMLSYKIYVIEQSGNETFNKGVLMNAGVKEALKDNDYHCFIFHDVDLIPEDDRNLYSCPSEPRHMSVAVDKFNYSLPYSYLVGGVFAITKAHFVLVNGYSNLYWGWGGEDDDMAYRLKFHNLKITRPPESVGRYTMIKHSHRAESPDNVRTALLRMAKRRAIRDGLNSVRYMVVDRKETLDYSHVVIEIGSVHRWSFPSPNKLVIHF